MSFLAIINYDEVCPLTIAGTKDFAERLGWQLKP